MISIVGNARIRSLTLIALAQIAAMTLWFSATAIVPSLIRDGLIAPTHASALTSAVQIGFVAGTLLFALLGLPDRIEGRRLFMASSLIAAAANALIVFADPASVGVLILRFITGMCMAGIYPVGVKLAAGWAKGDMGFLIGILVGALTLGSAMPHLFNALGGIDWRPTLLLSSVSAIVAAGAILFVTPAPVNTKAPPFRPGAVLQAFRDPALRLANFGYLGHMWELYAMWTWIGAFMAAALYDGRGASMANLAALASFAVIAIGALGCIIGGYIADRIGRTLFTAIAMAVSGLCAATIGLFLDGPHWLLIAIGALWGVSVIADSAQFSAAIAELSEPSLIGTMLTVQICAGFLLTLASINLIPFLVEHVGWRYAFLALSIGPALGALAMLRLRRRPESLRIAGGQR